jgi:hypothetical protein
MTVYTVAPVIPLTSSGSGYTSNATIATPVGSLRTTAIGQFEIWDGNNWTPFYNSISHYIERAANHVQEHVNGHAADNVTIQDALAEWLEACDRFKVIATLAEPNK